MSTPLYLLCPDCVTRVYRGFKCDCGGDPWEIDKPFEDFLNRIEYAILVHQAKKKNRQYNITRTDWTTEEPTCQKCGREIPLEERPVYMFLQYKGKSAPEGIRCIDCTAKYLDVEKPELLEKFAVPNAWFNNGEK